MYMRYIIKKKFESIEVLYMDIWLSGKCVCVYIYKIQEFVVGRLRMYIEYPDRTSPKDKNPIRV